ncbi:MAG TPA: hypothetical protein VGE74_02125, partial [Gemmata sp.]
APAAPFPTRAPSAPPPARAKPVRNRSARSGEGPRPAAVVPIAPPRQVLPKRAMPTATAPHDPEHDPRTPATGGLPFSVMVGFALMPFGIPLLWLLGPLVTGFSASLSLAVPVSLAVAASALCLGVVYTIDWTGTTRLKGVLMLVCLSYLAAAGMYFLKPALMERIQKFFSVAAPWVLCEVPGTEGHCHIKLPVPGAPPEVVRGEKPLAGIEWADGLRATHRIEGTMDVKTYTYFIVANSPRAPLVNADDRWFEEAAKGLKGATKAKDLKETVVPGENRPHRQWELTFPDSTAVRIVRVFVIKGRVYYLAVEGPELTPDNENLGTFFQSFNPDAKNAK